MLDDGSNLGWCKKIQRTTAERAVIVAESYELGAMVGGVAHRRTHAVEFWQAALTPLTVLQLFGDFKQFLDGLQFRLDWIYQFTVPVGVIEEVMGGYFPYLKSASLL